MVVTCPTVGSCQLRCLQDAIAYVTRGCKATVLHHEKLNSCLQKCLPILMKNRLALSDFLYILPFSTSKVSTIYKIILKKFSKTMCFYSCVHKDKTQNSRISKLFYVIIISTVKPKKLNVS